MSRVCTNCGKHPSIGCKISHSNRKALRTFRPNLVSKKIYNPETKKMEAKRICTSCIKTLRKNTKV